MTRATKNETPSENGKFLPNALRSFFIRHNSMFYQRRDSLELILGERRGGKMVPSRKLNISC